MGSGLWKRLCYGISRDRFKERRLGRQAQGRRPVRGIDGVGGMG